MKENTDKTTQNMKRVMRATGRERERGWGGRKAEKKTKATKNVRQHTQTARSYKQLFSP